MQLFKKEAVEAPVLVVIKQNTAAAAVSPAVVVYCASDITFKLTMKNRKHVSVNAGFHALSGLLWRYHICILRR